MGPRCGCGTTIALPSPRPSRERQLGGSGQTVALGSPQKHPSKITPTAPHPSTAPQPLLGYTWCFNKCFLFDFLIFVFSEKALASSNSFLRVAGRKQLGEGLIPKPYPKLPWVMRKRGAAVQEPPAPQCPIAIFCVCLETPGPCKAASLGEPAPATNRDMQVPGGRC